MNTTGRAPPSSAVKTRKSVSLLRDHCLRRARYMNTSISIATTRSEEPLKRYDRGKGRNLPVIQVFHGEQPVGGRLHKEGHDPCQQEVADTHGRCCPAPGDGIS